MMPRYTIQDLLHAEHLPVNSLEAVGRGLVFLSTRFVDIMATKIAVSSLKAQAKICLKMKAIVGLYRLIVVDVFKATWMYRIETTMQNTDCLHTLVQVCPGLSMQAREGERICAMYELNAFATYIEPQS